MTDNLKQCNKNIDDFDASIEEFTKEKQTLKLKLNENKEKTK